MPLPLGQFRYIASMTDFNTNPEPDRFNLARFVDAQEGVYSTALAELKSGHKRSHWMWFIFPQVDGLGSSSMSKRFAIRSLDEAREYLNHPVLGPRLRECCHALLAAPSTSPTAIMGHPDDLKLRSSMTLFALVADGHPEFESVLMKLFGGNKDAETLKILGESV